MKFYFAAPLFCEAERRYNADLAGKVESLGFEVFLPQRDGVVGASETDDGGDAAMRRARVIFELDLERIKATDIFFYLLDGRVPDEGAAVALGIAYADKSERRPDRLLLGLHTDGRAAFPDAALNPMLAASLDRVFADERSLLAYLGGLPRR